MSQMQQVNWMKNLSDSLAITDIAIPGTHDTMTEKCDHIYYKTQTLSLDKQLEIGVRFLDIRLTKNLVAAHREWISDINGQHIFDSLKYFLGKYPSEFIIMRIQNANENKDDFPEFRKAIHSLIGINLDVLLVPIKNNNHEFIWPTIKEARGKIIILECSPEEFNVSTIELKRWAYNWHNNEHIRLQDNWNGPEISEKIADIQDLATYPNQSIGKERKKLYLNHISATNGKLKNPCAYAEVLNKEILVLIQNIKDKKQKNDAIGKGILIYDFIDTNLSNQTILLNDSQNLNNLLNI